jgi:hypothetical protein
MNIRSLSKVVALLLLTAVMISVSFAQTTVSVSPASGSITPQVHYAVSVVVNNVEHLHAAHVVIGFDSAIVRVDSIKQGSFLVGSTFFSYVPNPFTSSTRTVTVDQAILGPSGSSGSGTLFTLHFTSLKVGSSSLTLQSVDLRDTMNLGITSANVGGTVTVLGIRLTPTVFLEGAYVSATTSMRTSLRTGGILSTKFPSVVIPAYAVDSVNVEIRDSASAAASTVRRFAPAWLLTDGTMRVFSDTTQSGVSFDGPAGTYYIVVRHRNHLAVMSGAAVSLSASAASVDFTTAMSAGYGTNPLKGVGSRYVMFAGEANNDGQITSSDFNVFNPRFRTAAVGYEVSDWNLDGMVTSMDFNVFNPNFRAAAMSRVPN